MRSLDPALAVELTIRSESLEERLDRIASVPEQERFLQEQAVARLLAPWSKAYSKLDEAALQRRLEWDGWDAQIGARAFCKSDWLPACDPAPWLKDFDEVVERMQAFAAKRRNDKEIAERNAWTSRVGTIPFAELWQPWVRHASESVFKSLHEETLSSSARIDLEAILLLSLTDLAELAVYEIYDTERGASSEPVRLAEFIHACLRDPVGKIFLHFPVLARQMTECVRQWRDRLLELADRIVSDREELGRIFGEGIPPGKVARIEGGLSDRHHDGREVLKIQFDSGLRLVYKPRNIASDEALYKIFEQLREDGLDIVPHLPKVLSRETWGWAALLEQEAAINQEEEREYYRRAGALIALAYAFRARDLHVENLIATRRGPAAIDAEMFFQPIKARRGTVGSKSTVTDSCLESGLLLQPSLGDGGVLRESGGLSPVLQRRRARAARRWTHVDRDDIRVEFNEVPGVLGENVFYGVDGRATAPAKYPEEIVDGFTRTLRFLAGKQQDLSEPGGVFEGLQGAQIRILLRPSQDYANHLLLTRLPRHQKTGVHAGLLGEASLTMFAGSRLRPLLWPLVREEKRSVLRGDVPRFVVEASSTDIDSSEGKIAGYLEVSGCEAVRQRLRSLDEEVLENQTRLLRLALAPPFRLEVAPRTRESFADAPLEVLIESMRDWAAAIGDALLNTSEEDLSPEDEWSLRRGRFGIALFLAAAGSVCERDSYTSASLEMIEPLFRDSLPRSFSESSARRIGGFSGHGGCLYASAWLSRFLKTHQLGTDPAEAGLNLAHRISPEEIHTGGYDLESGAAGQLLGLLALHDVTGESFLLELARECALRLESGQKLTSSAGAAWRSTDGTALAGWAHGAAGIARALSAAARRIPEERFKIAAAAALGYERSLYCSRRKNWPVLTSEDIASREVWFINWCHGAPGIALGRLMLPREFRDTHLREEIQTALQTTASAPFGGADHVCCGHAGRAGVLLSASERLEDPDGPLLGLARAMTAKMLDRARKEEGFRLSNDPLDARRCSPGFLRGLAGVGYHLLRCAAPRVLPDLAALELPSENDGKTITL